MLMDSLNGDDINLTAKPPFDVAAEGDDVDTSCITLCDSVCKNVRLTKMAGDKKNKQTSCSLDSERAHCLLMAVRRVRDQKQRPNIDRIMNSLRIICPGQFCSREVLMEELELAVSEGILLRVGAAGDNDSCSYRDPGRVVRLKTHSLHVTRDLDLTKMVARSVRELANPAGSTAANVHRYIRSGYKIQIHDDSDLESLIAKFCQKAVEVGKLVCVEDSDGESRYQAVVIGHKNNAVNCKKSSSSMSSYSPVDRAFKTDVNAVPNSICSVCGLSSMTKKQELKLSSLFRRSSTCQPQTFHDTKNTVQNEALPTLSSVENDVLPDSADVLSKVSSALSFIESPLASHTVLSAEEDRELVLQNSENNTRAEAECHQHDSSTAEAADSQLATTASKVSVQEHLDIAQESPANDAECPQYNSKSYLPDTEDVTASDEFVTQESVSDGLGTVEDQKAVNECVASDGHLGELVSCAECGNSGHAECLGFSEVVFSRLLTVRWQCRSCKKCSVCGELRSETDLLRCCECDRGFHIDCIHPSRRPQSADLWKCSFCDGKRRASWRFGFLMEHSLKRAYHRDLTERCTTPGCDGSGNANGRSARHRKAYACPLLSADKRPPRPQSLVTRPRHSLSDSEEDLSQTALNNLPPEVTSDDHDLYKQVREKALQSTLLGNSEFDPHSRNPPFITFGNYEVTTWYSSPYPQEYARLPMLYICEFCLKYIKSYNILRRHLQKCDMRCPPGDEIYRRHDLAVFEVDGNRSKIFCQNLCLLAKLFLDHKTLYYDVESFHFYVLTLSDSDGYHLVGYFSKEKYCRQKYNLSCIMTLPQYQRLGYGRFLIDFSYLLSQVEGQPGSPERPLSDLGRVSYESYWKSVVLSYLHAHRDSIQLSVAEMSEQSGVCSADIISTLHTLSILQCENDRYTLAVDWSVVSDYMSRERNGRLLLDQDCLQWNPPVHSDDDDDDDDSVIADNSKAQKHEEMSVAERKVQPVVLKFADVDDMTDDKLAVKTLRSHSTAVKLRGRSLSLGQKVRLDACSGRRRRLLSHGRAVQVIRLKRAVSFPPAASVVSPTQPTTDNSIETPDKSSLSVGGLKTMRAGVFERSWDDTDTLTASVLVECTKAAAADEDDSAVIGSTPADDEVIPTSTSDTTCIVDVENDDKKMDISLPAVTNSAKTVSSPCILDKVQSLPLDIQSSLTSTEASHDSRFSQDDAKLLFGNGRLDRWLSQHRAFYKQPKLKTLDSWLSPSKTTAPELSPKKSPSVTRARVPSPEKKSHLALQHEKTLTSDSLKASTPPLSPSVDIRKYFYGRIVPQSPMKNEEKSNSEGDQLSDVTIIDLVEDSPPRMISEHRTEASNTVASSVYEMPEALCRRNFSTIQKTPESEHTLDWWALSRTKSSTRKGPFKRSLGLVHFLNETDTGRSDCSLTAGYVCQDVQRPVKKPRHADADLTPAQNSGRQSGNPDASVTMTSEESPSSFLDFTTSDNSKVLPSSASLDTQLSDSEDLLTSMPTAQESSCKAPQLCSVSHTLSPPASPKPLTNVDHSSHLHHHNMNGIYDVTSLKPPCRNAVATEDRNGCHDDIKEELLHNCPDNRVQTDGLLSLESQVTGVVINGGNVPDCSCSI